MAYVPTEWVNGQPPAINATNLNKLEQGVVDANSSTIPVGGVIMYTGTFADIPSNWSLCNGSNGTVNLVDIFVYGTTTETEVGDTGGTANSEVVTHTHISTFTGVPLPDHTHEMIGEKWGAETGDGNSEWQWSGPNTFGVGTLGASSGTPSGTVDVTPEGVSGTGTNLPPYIKLAYIQRMS